MKAFLEHWKPVKGYKGLYEVSDFGDVRSLNYRCTGQMRVLKPAKNRENGYLKVNLYKEGKMKTHKVHRLVAQAFIENPNNLPCINHKDENKENNVVTNLEYCDHKYNNNYGNHNERVAKALRGVYNNPKKSKKVVQLTLDYIFVEEWASTQECGRNGFNQGAVSACCRNEYYSQGNVYKGYRWVKAEVYYKEAVA